MSKSPSLSPLCPSFPLNLPSFQTPLYSVPSANHLLSSQKGNLHEESKVQTTNNAGAPEIPTSLDNRAASKAHTDIKSQMSHAVDSVENKGPSNEELETALDGDGESSGSGNEGRGLEVPADEGSGQVGDGGSVQGAGEGGAGDALPRRAAEPGLLGVVDLEMGRDGAGETLLGEKGGGVGGGELVGLEGSVEARRGGVSRDSCGWVRGGGGGCGRLCLPVLAEGTGGSSW